MSAAADDILNAVKAIVEAEYPGRKLHVRRGSEMNPAVTRADMSPPCFYALCNEDRPTQMAWAGKKFVKYPVELGYVTIELPGARDARPGTAAAVGGDVEAVMARVAQLFLASRNESGKAGLRGVPVVSTCEVRPLAPYKLPFAPQTANVSRIRLEFETIEDA
jgi:hypothetical protein